jgi:hypothetical protein
VNAPESRAIFQTQEKEKKKMKSVQALGIAALFILLVTCAALFVHHGQPVLTGKVLNVICGLGFALGTVTVTYQYPVAGVTAPTTAQGLKSNTCRGTIAKSADGDTTATITHNMGISTAALALGQPEVTLTGLLVQATLSLPFITYTSGNVVTVTMQTTATSGTANPQIQFFIRRPHSIAI